MNLQKINEVLTKTQEKDAISLTHDDHDISNTDPKHDTIHKSFKEIRDVFLSQHPVAAKMFAKGGEKRDWQIRYPVKFSSAGNLQPDSKVATFLRRELKCRVDLEDYTKGVCRRKTMVGDESRGIPMKEKEIVISIGKLLDREEAPDHIKKAFMNDPFRKSSGTVDYDIIITGHPIDIYGGSTGRGWTSCMNVGDKTFKDDDNEHHERLVDTNLSPQSSHHFETDNAASFIKQDINHQHHMAYLVPRGGDIDHDAIARTSYKLHSSLTGGRKTTLLPENTVYGDPPEGFLKKANEIMGELFAVEDGIFAITTNAYCDSSRLKSVGLIDPSKFDLYSLRVAYNKLEDESDAEQLASQVYDSLTHLNAHDKAIIMEKLFAESDYLEIAYRDVIDNMDSSIADNNIDDIISTVGMFIEVEPDRFESHQHNHLEDTILSNFSEMNLSRYWQESELFHKRLTEMIAHLANCYEIEHIDSAEQAITEVTEMVAGLNFSRMAFSDMHLTDMEYQKDPFIRSFLLYKHMHKNLAGVAVLTFMKNKTLTQSFNEFLLEYCEYVNAANRNHSQVLQDIELFGEFFDWLSNAKYKTLDVLYVLEQEHGDDKLEVDLPDMETMKDWITVFLMEMAGIEFSDGDLPDFSDDQLEEIKSKVNAYANNADTKSRMYEILGIDEKTLNSK